MLENVKVAQIKKFKKQSPFIFEFCFWEDPPHPVNWSPTDSTGPPTLFLQISALLHFCTFALVVYFLKVYNQKLIFPKCIFPKCIYPKCISAKCTRLACLLSFASLLKMIWLKDYKYDGGGWITDASLKSIHKRWCTRGGTPEEIHQRICTTGDATEVMQQWWCTRSDAPEVMHLR